MYDGVKISKDKNCNMCQEGANLTWNLIQANLKLKTWVSFSFLSVCLFHTHVHTHTCIPIGWLIGTCMTKIRGFDFNKSWQYDVAAEKANVWLSVVIDLWWFEWGKWLSCSGSWLKQSWCVAFSSENLGNTNKLYYIQRGIVLGWENSKQISVSFIWRNWEY